MIILGDIFSESRERIFSLVAARIFGWLVKECEFMLGRMFVSIDSFWWRVKKEFFWLLLNI